MWRCKLALPSLAPTMTLQATVALACKTCVSDAGALPWLKDPFNPEGDPLQQVLNSTVALQLEREATSLATMGCLAVLLVHLPIKLASVLAPSLFPLSFHAVESVTELPADMLLLHVALPFTLSQLDLK